MKRPALKPELKLGADKKKAALLGGLLVVAGIVYFINKSDTPRNEPGPAASSARRIDPAAPVASAPVAPRTAPRASARSRNFAQKNAASTALQEFRPTLKPKDPIDPSRIDPTLRLGLLAKLRKVGVESGGRSLFDFSGAPAPGAPKTEIAKVKPIVPGQTTTASAFVGPVEPKPEAPKPQPPPPPIPLKFYGFTNPAKTGAKRAFFLEGDDIFVAGEGEMIKNRYKVVRIGVNSAVVEDTAHKHQQTLPLEAEQVNT